MIKKHRFMESPVLLALLVVIIVAICVSTMVYLFTDNKNASTKEMGKKDVVIESKSYIFRGIDFVSNYISEIEPITMNENNETYEINKEENYIYHTITYGDTLSEIAQLYLGDANDWIIIQDLNNNIDPLSLSIGMKLKIPADKIVEEEVITDNDRVYLLARIIHAEANNQPYNGKIAVGNVIMNRVESNAFPNTIKKVIYQEGQFSPVSNGSINNEPSKKSIEAAKDVLGGERVIPENVLYFYNPDTATSRWIFSREVFVEIGNHAFAL